MNAVFSFGGVWAYLRMRVRENIAKHKTLAEKNIESFGVGNNHGR